MKKIIQIACSFVLLIFQSACTSSASKTYKMGEVVQEDDIEITLNTFGFAEELNPFEDDDFLTPELPWYISQYDNIFRVSDSEHVEAYYSFTIKNTGAERVYIEKANIECETEKGNISYGDDDSSIYGRFQGSDDWFDVSWYGSNKNEIEPMTKEVECRGQILVPVYFEETDNALYLTIRYYTRSDSESPTSKTKSVTFQVHQ